MLDTIGPMALGDPSIGSLPQRYDPLRAQRNDPDAPQFDVFTWGPVFLDIIFAGLPERPRPGTEVFADGMASCPGGIANLAVAASRLGLRTSLAAAFSDDDYGDFCFRTLREQEGIDLSCSERFAEWHSPVTVSVSVDGDRQMITHAHPPPVSADEMIDQPPTARALMVNLADMAADTTETSWITTMADAGSLVFVDAGWDQDEVWPASALDHLEGCYAFLPNAVEAMAYTRTDSPQQALFALADRVPLAVVTDGKVGAYGIDSTTGEEAQVAAIHVDALDPTGAGDVFGAAMIMGTLAEWNLTDRLTFASLCAGLALQQFGGSLAAPGWGDIIDWWQHLSDCTHNDAYHRSLRRRFAFLEAIAPDVPHTSPRRATATIARQADLDGLR